MKKIGLIGFPLQHSFSKGYFTDKFQQQNLQSLFSYDNFPLKTIEELPELISTNPDILALQVTAPYKETVLQFTKFKSEEVGTIGACNLLLILQNGIMAYNTDEYGFSTSIKEWLPKKEAFKALIFGEGGASKAAQYSFYKLRIPYLIVSRKGTGDIGYQDITASIANEYKLWINTTPVGTYPDIKTCLPLPYEFLTPNHYLYDMVYNPLKTQLLLEAEQRGAQTTNGLRMLHLQADRAFQYILSAIS